MSAPPEPRLRGIDTDVTALRSLAPDRAFERMYQKHASDVYRYALAVLRDAGDAEDVTQTTFLNAFRALQRGERPLKAKSWLLAIAHNVCRQRFRNAARRPQQVAFDEDVAEAIVPEESPSADDLVRALQQLSFNQRSALVMRELEGRSYKEIGEILALPVSAVETLLFRARRALREQIETSITCNEAEEMLSRQLDGRLPRSERGALRAHLRGCDECARFARSQRAQRSAWKALSVIPLPGSLGSLFGGGGTAVATGVAAKVAAVGVAAAIIGGGTYEGVRVVQAQVKKEPAKTAAVVPAAVTPTPRDATPQRVAFVTPGISSHPGRRLGAQTEHASRGKGHAKKAGKKEYGPSSASATPTEATPTKATPDHAYSPGQAKKATSTSSVRSTQPAEKSKKKAKKKSTRTRMTGHSTSGGTNGHRGSGAGGKFTAKSTTPTSPGTTAPKDSTAPGSGKP
jgi:RNA polymerase sigma factor (sigma-70 family)